MRIEHAGTAIIVVASLAPILPDGKPPPFTSAQRYDFGTVSGPIPTRVSHSFSMRNDSTEAIAVAGVTTSCGCTAAGMHEKVLMPGEYGSLDLEMSLAEAGSKTTSAEVMWSDGSRTTYTLSARMRISKQFFVSERIIRCDRGSSGELIVTYVSSDGDEPPEPTFLVDSTAVRVEVNGWERPVRHGASQNLRVPERFQCRVSWKTSEEFEGSARCAIAIGEMEPVGIRFLPNNSFDRRARGQSEEWPG